MAIRIFRCRECGHRMRMSFDTCGRCNEYKKPHQRLYFYVVPVMALPVMMALLLTPPL